MYMYTCVYVCVYACVHMCTCVYMCACVCGCQGRSHYYDRATTYTYTYTPQVNPSTWQHDIKSVPHRVQQHHIKSVPHRVQSVGSTVLKYLNCRIIKILHLLNIKIHFSINNLFRLPLNSQLHSH